MSDTSVLARLINNNALIELDNHYSKKKVVLVEHECASELVVTNVPVDSVVVDLDSNFSNDRLFSCTEGECKRGDYMIISEDRKKIVFIEMKKGKAKLEDIVTQLKGSKCLFDYIQSIGCSFFSDARFLADYELRFVAITRTIDHKRKTEITKPSIVNSTPTDPLKVSWTCSIQYNQIAN